MASKEEHSKSPENNQSIEELRGYWTPKRMRQAIPATNKHPQKGVKEVKRKIDERSEDKPLISLPRPGRCVERGQKPALRV